MSLKDRLNLQKQENPTQAKKNIDADNYLNIFEKIITEDSNILIVAPMNVPTSIAMNFVGNKLNDTSRIVAIGDNITFQKSELVKFEPDTKNMAKDLIITSLNLNASKILLKDFIGVEAVDIIKLSNAGIKNIITAVTANSAKNALSQMELNLYLSGVNIPEELMKKLISQFINRIVLVERYGDSCYVSKIYELKLVKGEYVISDMLKLNSEKNKEIQKGFNPESIGQQSNIIEEEEEIEIKQFIPPLVKPASRKSVLAKKLKRKH